MSKQTNNMMKKKKKKKKTPPSNVTANKQSQERANLTNATKSNQIEPTPTKLNQTTESNVT